MNQNHALVIGGTGMLRGVCLWLTKQGYVTSVIGRSGEKHQALKDKASRPDLIHSILVDYNNHPLLEEMINHAIYELCPISLVVSWTPNIKSID